MPLSLFLSLCGKQHWAYLKSVTEEKPPVQVVVFLSVWYYFSTNCFLISFPVHNFSTSVILALMLRLIKSWIMMLFKIQRLKPKNTHILSTFNILGVLHLSNPFSDVCRVSRRLPTTPQWRLQELAGLISVMMRWPGLPAMAATTQSQ